MTPTVTVVIPCHNHCGWINDAIDSVARQDYDAKRVIVVDDGSTDGSTKAVVDRLYRPKAPEKQGEPWVALGQVHTHGKMDLFIHRFPQARGPAFARNWGIKNGWEGTDIFGFLDSDDLYEPGKLTKSVAKFLQAPDHIGAVYSDFDTLRPDGLRLRQYKEPFDKLRLTRECLVNCDSLVSKKALETVGLFDEDLRVCEDFDLWLRVADQYVLAHIAESLVTVRVGEHSSSATIPSERWQRDYARVMQKMQERLRSNNV